MLLKHYHKLKDEVKTVKTTLNEMSLLVHKMAETQAMMADKLLNNDDDKQTSS